MALEFLCSDKIESGKKIILSRCANLYYLDFSNNKIDFYYSNPRINGVELNNWEIYQNTREMDFEFRNDKIGGYIIIPRFYDVKGNLLKIGNR